MIFISIISNFSLPFLCVTIVDLWIGEAVPDEEGTAVYLKLLNENDILQPNKILQKKGAKVIFDIY